MSEGSESTAGAAFNPGDLVVHLTHGVSRFRGMRLLPADGVTKEYFQLEYDHGDRIFVPAEHVGRLTKHLGEDVPLARLTTEGPTRTAYGRPVQK